jgi:GDP-L-fucose synthase
MIYKNKRILVTGGTGMIGRSLINELIKKEANKIYVVSIDKTPEDLPKGVSFINLDLTEFRNCKTACEGIDFVFHLAGIKGSPKLCEEQPASFMVPMLMFNTNMMEAASRENVQRYLYTSSVGVYHPAPLLIEDDVWKTFPSENDKFAGWTKRIGELQAEAYQKQHKTKMEIRIVRPTNIYGPYDNFDPEYAMVVPSLISRVDSGENHLYVWGDGTQKRDFMYTDDCAEGILKVFESDETRPVNLGFGPPGNSIKELVDLVIKYSDNKPEVVWDISKPSGDKIRVLDTHRAYNLGFNATTTLEKGIKKTIKWYKNNREKYLDRYNVFAKG